jgi:hypothetical protein
MKNWSIIDSWNNSVASEDREIKPRNYLYASEIGQSHIDIILKLKGEKQTNPPNSRSKRKFMMGNLIEDIVYLTLLRCGLIIEAQKPGKFQYDGLLMVSGRCDFIAGGMVDYEKSKRLIIDMRLTEWMEAMSLSILGRIASEMGDTELKPMVIENKSVSHFMFEKYSKAEAPNPHHAYQLFHYLKSFGMDEGRILYASKDDALMLEFPVYNPSDVEKGYKKEIEIITEYYNSGVMPPKEDEIIFDQLAGKFSKSWKVEYSPYLTMLYPHYERPDQYADAVKPLISKWNRVLARIKKIESGEKNKPNKKYPDGAPIVLTAKNIEAVDEMKRHGFEAFQLAKVADVQEEEVEETEA